ncbi:MAG TPA: TolC family protein [Bryobacteraceae bacterium]|nr:TolC family protein [Bryobacteraceae bacterium]
MAFFSTVKSACATVLMVSLGMSLCGQQPGQPAPPAAAPSASAPLTITFQEALDRARKYGIEIQQANITALLAREDRIQAKAAMLPQAQSFNQFIYTQPNGTPSGVFVANDGPHVYSIQAQAHQDFSLTKYADYRRTIAAEVVAKAKADVAARGLVATTVQDYYAVVIAQRKLVNAQQTLEDARKFLDITQKQERGGEAAHADVVKAELQVRQHERDVSDAQLAIDKARVALAVLIFPDFRSDFTAADDLDQVTPLAPFAEVQDLALSKSPELRAAHAEIEASGAEIGVAKAAYLPALSLDYFYGLNANEVALYNREHLNLVGSVAQATLTIPVWNWGATSSKVRQAELKVKQAQLDLSLAQRTLMANLNSFYLEAQLAQAQLDSLRKSVELSAESLRLTVLRYQAGEATALEVVDAQTTLAQARNALDDGLSRYRVAQANIQTLTGTF